MTFTAADLERLALAALVPHEGTVSWALKHRSAMREYRKAVRDPERIARLCELLREADNKMFKWLYYPAYFLERDIDKTQAAPEEGQEKA